MKHAGGKTSGRGATFLGGVLVLTAANLLVKLFGFLYKVPLNGALGDEMANVNTAYSVYTLLYMISTAGIPVAVSVLVSRARAEGKQITLARVFRVSLSVLAAVGALGTAGMLVFSRPIAAANSGGDSYLCLLAIAPSLFFVCIESVLRGYFQGFGLMTPTAVSGILEALGKTVLGLSFVYLVLAGGGGASLAAAYSVLAITAGVGLGALYLSVALGHYRRRGLLSVVGNEVEGEPTLALLGKVLRIAVPIAATAAVMSAASLLDGQLLRPLLGEYYRDAELAKAVFSDYTTGAVTLFNMPAILVYPIASAIVPYITAAISAGRREAVGRYAASALRIAILISVPAALGLSTLSYPILSAVFVGDEGMAAHAGDALSILALSVVPLALLAVSNAILQAIGRQGRPILSMLVGLAAKVIVLYVATPRVGLLSAPLGTLLFYLLAALCNLFFLLRYVPLRLDPVRGVLVPFLAGTLSSGVAALVFSLVASQTPALLLGVISAMTVYPAAMLLLGGIHAEDLALLPRGERILRLFLRFRSKRARD